MPPKRKRRSIQERIADRERELQELREQALIVDLQAALKEGRVPSGNRTEFTTRLRELRLVIRAIKAAERHNETALIEPLKDFQGKLAESMAGLVEEGGPSSS